VIELRRAVAAVDAEGRARAAQRERARQENAAQTERRVLMAQARLATKELRIEIDRRWFWSTMGEMLDMLRACAADAKKRSATADARTIERVIDAAGEQLEKNSGEGGREMSFAYSDEAMAKERIAMRRWLGANIPESDAKVVPIDRASRKRPLFTGPIQIDDDPPKDDAPPGSFSFRFADGKTQEHRDTVVTAGWAYQHLDIIGGALLELNNELADQVVVMRDRLDRRVDGIEAAHRKEIAELKLLLTEARCELREMRAIQESARVLSRGEQGLIGPRGVSGSQGPIGPRGEAGPAGLPAPSIAGWEPRVEQYQLVPVYSTGERGPPASLRAFFEQYDAQTNGADDAEG
jgi:hypothetical protein